jgi:hypothetical protein
MSIIKPHETTLMQLATAVKLGAGDFLHVAKVRLERGGDE